MIECLSAPYDLENLSHVSTASIGVTVFSGKEFSVEDLLKQADVAMYQAKTAGRNNHRFFDPAMQTAATANPGFSPTAA